MTAFTIIIISTFILIGLSMGFMPYYNSKGGTFGVTLPKEYIDCEEIRPLKAKFLWGNIILSIIHLIPTFILSNVFEEEVAVKWISVYLIVGIFTFMIISGIFYIIYHKRVKAFKEGIPKEAFKIEEQEIFVDTNYRKGNIVVSHFTFGFVNLFVLAVIVAITFINYHKIPEMYPINFDVNMQPNNFIKKTPLSVLVMPLIIFFLDITMLICNIAIEKSKQKINPAKARISLEQSRRFRYANSMFLFIMSIALSIMMGYIHLMSIFSAMNKTVFWTIFILFMVITLGGAIYLTVKYGQGGERYKVKTKTYEDEIKAQWYDDDKYWIFGSIYFNKEDPSVWVEKRVGIGFTINFANWKGWLFIISMIILPIIPVFMIK